MTEGVAIFLGGVAFGTVICFALALERFMRMERPKIDLVVTKEVFDQLNGRMVSAWLDERGMTWMPKGREFKAKVEL